MTVTVKLCTIESTVQRLSQLLLYTSSDLATLLMFVCVITLQLVALTKARWSPDPDCAWSDSTRQRMSTISRPKLGMISAVLKGPTHVWGTYK